MRTVSHPMTFVVLLVTVFRGLSVEASEPVQLRVLTYNIHHGEGVDRKLDLERIAAVIRKAEPDLVALQELDQGVSRTNRVDQPEALAGLTGMNVVFGDNIEFGGGKYGNAVLSRFPIEKHRNHSLPNVDKGEQRGVMETVIRISGIPTPVILYATHLDHRSDDRERFASAKFINKLAVGYEGPSLLAGDLNDTADSRTLREFVKVWQPANTQPLLTVPVSQPRRQIDFLLFRPAGLWKVLDARVLPEAVASDHRAVLAVLEFRRPSPGR